MQNIYETFEFNKIKEKILEYARSELAKSYIQDLDMFPSIEEVESALLDLKEMNSIILRFGLLPIHTSANALFLIDLAKKTGLLTPHDLSLIAEDILTSQNIIKYFDKIDVSYIRIKDIIATFNDLSSLEREIHRVISSSLTIKDDATPELKEIRQKIRRVEATLQSKIASLSLTYQSYLNDDNATIRDGHFVLPVKTSEKSKVIGIIYDVSQSGATTFIEPMEVVQLNNQLTSLHIEENEECRKILKQLTALVLLQEGEVIHNNKIIADLDFLSAKSLYMNEIDGVIADISEKQIIDLVDARHPLIDKNKVVANSYYLDDNKSIVIISGPNAGGKTVSLKTVGLLTIMHQCGLALPASKAKLGYFNHIYIDIGDNQSLSDNLSTFSAHMSNIASIVKVVKGKDLVLLDELGTGTDPKEGEALALSVTKTLEKKHALAMISSHFEALKEYAFLSQNIENSSMIFDEEKLLPTYKFKYAAPGHSYALDVASRYGIPEDIILDAKSYLKDNNNNETQELLYVLQKKIENETLLEDELKKKEKELNNLEKKLVNDEKLLKERREKLLEDVTNEKEQIIQKAKDEVDEIISMLSKGDDLKLHEVIALRQKIDDLEEAPDVVTYNEEIVLGDHVSVPSLNIYGVVKRIKGKKAQVYTDDGLIMDIAIDKLHKEEKVVEKKKIPQKQNYDSIMKLNVGLELNIIGMRVDEAKPILEKYIDDCRVKHFKVVRIIHGFGSGALRKLTHDYLSKQKDLTFTLGGANDGGGGATVVTFK
ncbi:MAG: Smr/MutS family protein [Bacilli bacterium]|nr:Smr/MutS family protein [Bacilli bacterium]